MNLLFFTPVLLRSSIGGVSRCIIEQLLSQGHQITVVSTEDTMLCELPIHKFPVEVVNWQNNEKILAIAKMVDIVFYQFGNNFSFHRGSLEWFIKLPGIICLHDYFLGHLFFAWSLQDRNRAKMILQKWYGEEVEKEYFNFNNSENFINYSVDKAPMTEWVCEKALGVICHSSWGIQRVITSCPGPIEILALPYSKAIPVFTTSIQTSHEFIVLTIGNINPNKRVESILFALGRSNILREKTHYRLAGNIEKSMVNYLLRLADQLDVQLSILGEIDDDTLNQEISRANIIACLRWPVLEGASASAVESMFHEKTILVTDAGFYQELPDNCVCKIPIKNEIKNLQQKLEYFYLNPDDRLAMGKRAAVWAKKNFDSEKYAHLLIDFSRQVLMAKPIINASHKMANILSRWGGTNMKPYKESLIDPLMIFQKDCESDKEFI